MSRRRTTLRGFTIVEIMTVIVILGILMAIVVFSYGGWRRNTTDTTLKSDAIHATASLKSYNNFKNSFPPNLAGIDFAASDGNALTLYTDTPTVGVYDGLSTEQNAQLLLNTCNANLNGLNNTVCTFAGHGGGAKVHVKGTVGSNTIWRSPIQQSDITLSCGNDCNAATSTMVSQFTAQGGTFPVLVSGSSSTLPKPTQTPNGKAANFCLEARSGAYSDLIYHTTNTNRDATAGACPNNPDLHYYP